jgi:YfiH family protein
MSIPFEQSPDLAAIPGIRHGFFGRQGGVSTGVFASLNMSESGGDRLNLVAINRAQAVEILGFPASSLATLKQVHSSTVVTLSTQPIEGSQIEADALVTNVRGFVLGILTADCAPILFADPEAGVIGAAHAGWKGATSGIVDATIVAMVALGAVPGRIVAAIGPTITAANYQVGAQFADDLLARHPNAVNRISKPRGGREHFDLPGFVADQLRSAGIGQVHEMGVCTYADAERYFSHRRATHEGTTTGRQIALIGLA